MMQKQGPTYSLILTAPILSFNVTLFYARGKMQDLWFCVTPAALRAGCAALSVATLELPLI